MVVPWCVRFSPNANVVVAGDDSGCVSVYKLSGGDSTAYSHKEQVFAPARPLSPTPFFFRQVQSRCAVGAEWVRGRCRRLTVQAQVERLEKALAAKDSAQDAH